MKKTLNWMVWTSLSLALFYFGVFQGITGAYNIWLALTVVASALSCMIYVDRTGELVKNCAKRYLEHPRSVWARAMVGIALNSVLVLILLWSGKWFAAIILAGFALNTYVYISSVSALISRLTDEELGVLRDGAKS